MSSKQPFRLRPFKRGQPLTANRLNEPINAINRILPGIAPIRQLLQQRSGAATTVTVARFIVTDASPDDYLVCREYDGTQTGDSDIYIARPPLLRASVTSRGDVTYTYTDSQTRSATDGVDTETQVIIPSYLAGDEIYAERGIVRGTGVYSDPEGTQKVEWLARADGRAWTEDPDA